MYFLSVENVPHEKAVFIGRSAWFSGDCNSTDQITFQGKYQAILNSNIMQSNEEYNYKKSDESLLPNTSIRKFMGKTPNFLVCNFAGGE